MELAVAVVFLLAFATSLCYCLHGTAVGALLLTVFKMLLCKGRRSPGQLTGVWFPISVEELTSSQGPRLLTKMLRHGQHLPPSVAVTSVRNLRQDIKDGVKGDKALLEVTYSDEVDLPKTFFVKFNLQKIGAMRLLVATSEICLCEALFYHHLAEKVGEFLKTPKCFFVDFNKLTGEFCLLTEALNFGQKPFLPLKHRIRNAASLEEQLLFVENGAKLHCNYWADNEVVRNMPKFHETHREMWVLCALSGRFGLSYTMQKTLRGTKVNEEWMTWECPSELMGKELELIHDMPQILTSLSKDPEMAAFGHNDLTTDNAFYWIAEEKLHMGLFDWQQSCVNNVAQEWAWNWHFLEPDFLTEHEDTTYTNLSKEELWREAMDAHSL